MVSKEQIAIWMVAAIMFATLLVENNILSKKIAALYKQMVSIEFYLRDGVCE